MTMLQVANCPQCGKVFQKNLRNLCQECIRELDNGLNKCIGFLRDTWKATTTELSKHTGVSEQQIVTFIKENRIPIGGYPNLTYPCNSCSVPIRQHHLCTNCRIRILSDIQKLKEQEVKKKERGIGFQMHYHFEK